VVCELARVGYRALDEFGAGAGGPFSSARRFENADGNVVVVLLLAPGVQLAGSASDVRAVNVAAKSDRVVATGYPGNLRLLYNAAPAAMSEIGLMSAVVSLPILEAAVERTPHAALR